MKRYIKASKYMVRRGDIMKIYSYSNLLSDVDIINNLITSGDLTQYDTHPYNGIVTRAALGPDGEIDVYGMYNNTEIVIASFSSMQDFYDYYDEKYHLLDLI